MHQAKAESRLSFLWKVGPLVRGLREDCMQGTSHAATIFEQSRFLYVNNSVTKFESILHMELNILTKAALKFFVISIVS